jgi:transposase-like protein
MWHVTSQKYGANALGLQRILGLGSYHTAWEWLHRLRRAMVRPERDLLSGLVEVDETLIGGAHAGKPGRGAIGKALVAVAVEDTGTFNSRGLGIGRIRLEMIEDASALSLCSFVARNIQPGSHIRTDGWLGYIPLARNGYHHHLVPAVGTEITHRVAALLKRWLLGTYQGAVRCHQLPYYLDEFTFRFNRRKATSRGLLFYRLLQQAVLTPPVPATELHDNAAKGHGFQGRAPG